MNTLYKAWITINRSCNLRCSWCYAAGTKYQQSDSMDSKLACNILDFLSDLEVNEVVFLGGEPTCCNYLIDLIKYSKNKNMRSQLITNGILLNKMQFIKEIVDAGVNFIDISLKGYSAYNYFSGTGYDGYSQVMNAIKNTNSLNVPFSVSMVLGHKNINNFLNGINDAKNCGAKKFHFSFCNDFSALDTGKKNSDYSIENNIFEVVNGFMRNYEKLREITNDCFTLHQTFPLCVWDTQFIELLNSRNQIVSSCHVFTREGIIFDTQGNVIPCNSMHQVKLGQWGCEFSNPEEFLVFWNSKDISSYYQRIASNSVPHENCLRCNEWQFCGGGCLSNWYNYSFDELLKAKENYFAFSTPK